MTYKELMDKARPQMGPICKACYVCDGRACGNSMPGPGCKPPGNVASRNYQKWQEICVNMDTICGNEEPKCECEFFGKKLKMPVMAAPLGGMRLHYGDKHSDPSYSQALVKACFDNGIMAFVGDNGNFDIFKGMLEAMPQIGGFAVPTIKPWHKQAVYERIELANEYNAPAIAMDIDGAGLPFLKQYNVDAGAKTVEELREIIDYAGKPFIIKGIMTPQAAEKAIEAGAAAIVVSNHGGRVLGGLPSTCEVLPGIAEQVAGRIKLIVDGGIRSGLDVFRALALGADFVLIGRPVATALYGDDEAGLKLYIDKIEAELKDVMTMTGCKKLSDIDGSKIFGE